MSDSNKAKDEAVKKQLDGKLDILDSSPLDEALEDAASEDQDTKRQGLTNIHDAGHS